MEKWFFFARRCYSGVTSMLQAELMEILFLLEVVKHEGARAQYVEFDFITVIQEINNPTPFPWRSVIFDILSLRNICGVCYFTFIFRIANQLTQNFYCS